MLIVSILIATTRERTGWGHIESNISTNALLGKIDKIIGEFRLGVIRRKAQRA